MQQETLCGLAGTTSVLLQCAESEVVPHNNSNNNNNKIILWNQQLQTDRAIPNNKPDI
jgi:hypothetical protein